MEYVRDLKFEDVHIYKLAKTDDEGERSPSGSSDSSGSPKEGAASSEIARKHFVDGNLRYLQSDKYQQQISLVQYIIDDMATDPLLLP